MSDSRLFGARPVSAGTSPSAKESIAPLFGEAWARGVHRPESGFGRDSGLLRSRPKERTRVPQAARPSGRKPELRLKVRLGPAAAGTGTTDDTGSVYCRRSSDPPTPGWMRDEKKLPRPRLVIGSPGFQAKTNHSEAPNLGSAESLLSEYFRVELVDRKVSRG